MSRIGKKPVVIGEGITVDIKEDSLEVRSANKTLALPILPGIKVEQKENKLVFAPQNSTKQTLSNWGTMRALTENAVRGATEDFTKVLIIEGVGYRASIEGQNLLLNLGYSHSVKFSIPEGIKVTVEKNTVSIAGHNKQLVGETAAQIRRLRKPEPYKGKGIRYADEVIKRKAGKKAVGKTG